MSDRIAITLKVMPEDLDKIDANAEAAGLSRSAWLVEQGLKIGGDAGEPSRLRWELERVRGQLEKLIKTIDLKPVTAKTQRRRHEP